jgi:hypothetical protein
MALAVVKILPDLPQAQVAASVLDAAGFHPILMDLGTGSVLWTIQFAIGGFRLAVPEDEADAAIALLRSCAALDPIAEEAPPPAAGGLIRPVAGVALALAAGADLGWLAARRRSFPADWWLGVLLATTAVIALVILLYLIGWFLHPPRFSD